MIELRANTKAALSRAGRLRIEDNRVVVETADGRKAIAFILPGGRWLSAWHHKPSATWRSPCGRTGFDISALVDAGAKTHPCSLSAIRYGLKKGGVPRAA